MAYALAAALILSLVALILVFLSLRSTTGALLSAEKRRKEEVSNAIQLTSLKFEGERRRFEDHIKLLKAELKEVEDALAQCSDPVAVRTRLNRMFPPEASSDPTDDRLPDGTTPKT